MCSDGRGDEQEQNAHHQRPISDCHREVEEDPGGQGQEKGKGDDWKKKMTGRTRVANLNVGRLPVDPEGTKQVDLLEWMVKGRVDIMGLNEVGLKWTSLRRDQGWKERVRGTFQTERAVWAWNETDPIHESTQWGGTGMVTVDKTTAKIASTGKDTSKMGRWVWTELRGTPKTTVVLSFYQPVRNSKGALSVYRQQRTALLEQGSDEDPIKRFRDDLELQILQWMEEGKQIVAMGDVNESIVDGDTASMLIKIGMHNAMEGLDGFETYQRNTSNKQIDGIWVTPGLSIHARGYTEYAGWDHRTAWIDLGNEEVFGNRKIPDLHVEARRLRLRDHDAVEKYIRHYTKEANKAKLLERAQSLDEKIGRQLSEEDQRELEQLDTERTAMMLKAEKQCRKLPMGKVPFSPEVMQPAWEMAFWKTSLRRREGKKTSSRLMARQKMKAGITTRTRNMTIEDIKAEVEKAKDAWRQAKQMAVTKRQRFLERLAEKYANEQRTQKEKVLKTLIEREKTKESWKRIRWAIKGNERGGITHVIGPNATGNRETFDTERSIVRCCINENKKKYRQTDNTPFMQGRLRQAMGNTATTTAATQTLEGRPPTTGLPDKTVKFITELKKPHTAREWTDEDLHIGLAEHKQGWRVAKENTSSSPSGLHFRLWKANATVDALAEIDRIMRAIPFRTGYSLRRWQVGVDVELCKKAGNYNVEKLRTIVLLEGDYNMNNKTMSRRVAAAGEQDGTLAEEQYGSRQRHSAPDVSLNNRLTDDIMRQTRTGGVIISNDAKSCYDRIVHAVLSLCLQRMGVAREPIKSLIETMQHLTHHVKTAYGVSAESYKADQGPTQMQGILQGNAMGPMGWAAVSTPIIHMMKRNGFSFRHWNAVTKEAVEFACFAYVDDTDLVHTKLTHTSDESFLMQVQDAIDHWEGGLHASGGALAPEKSYWYWIDFQYERGKWRYKTAAEMPGEVTMKNAQGQSIPLLRLEANESRRALGVMPRRDGSDADNLAYLKRKGEIWSDSLRTSKLSRAEAWMATKSTIWKSFEFPARSMCATTAQLRTAIKPALTTALHKSGIQRCFPRQVAFGDPHSLGLGLQDPHVLQTWSHVQAVAQHMHRQTLTGKLLRASYEELKTEAGVMGDLLGKDYNKWAPLLTDCWWKHTWRDTSHYGIQLHPPDANPRETGWREGDTTIMETLSNGGIRGATLKHVNRCRMYLRVVWVSEITDASGRYVRETSWKGHREDVTFRDKDIWPRTATPSQSDWRAWRHALKHNIIDPSQSHTRQLKRFLGKFYAENGPDRHWVWWRSPTGDALLQHTPTGWAKWTEVSRRKYQHTGTTEQRPQQSYNRVTIRPVDTFCKVATVEGRPDIAIADPATPTERWRDNWSTRGARLRLASWIEALRNGTAVAVSDGSWKDSFGAAAYRVGSSRTKRWDRIGTGETWITGGVSESGSHRAELAGLHAIMKTVIYGEHSDRITEGKVTIGCDNKSALRSLDKTACFNATEADYDLLEDIQSMVRNTNITVESKHVKGHQDSRGIKLTQWERWNVAMDLRAKAAWRTYTGMGRKPHDKQATGETVWTATLRGRQVQKADTSVIYAATTREDTRQAWRKYMGHPTEWAKVDWTAIERAAKYVGEGKKIWVVKHLSGNSGTSETLVKWKYRESAKCPRCDAAVETHDHVLLCNAKGTDAIWGRYMAAIDDIGDKCRLLPAMVGAIKHALGRWRGQKRATPRHDDTQIRRALVSQQGLGWGAFVKGFVVADWRSVQDTFEKRREDKYRTGGWAAKLVEAGWDYMSHMWMQRNEELHKTDGDLTQLREDQLDEAIRVAKASPEQDIDESARDLWREATAVLLRRPLGYKKQWLRAIWAAKDVGNPVAFDTDTCGLRKWMVTGRL